MTRVSEAPATGTRAGGVGGRLPTQIPQSPVVVVGRPRSGTRVVAGLLSSVGCFMGADLAPDYLDSLSWYRRCVVPLVTSRFFPDWPTGPELDRLWSERLADTWPGYTGGRPLPTWWGWKYPETLFVLPLLQREFPRLRVVHVIRDGRDVGLSRGGFFQATGALGDPPGWDPPETPPWARRVGVVDARPSYRDFCLAVTFGDPAATSWHGIDLADPVARARNRFLIGIQAWVLGVGTARAYGAAMGSRYYEIRYEDLCAQPAAVIGALLRWLRVPEAESTAAAIARAVHADRVGAWRRQTLTAAERRDFDAGTAFAADLLADLGYQLSER